MNGKNTALDFGASYITETTIHIVKKVIISRNQLIEAFELTNRQMEGNEVHKIKCSGMM